MALCCLLAFWTGGNATQMDRLFRQSGLYREKWDEVHYADGSTYGEKTVERAIQTTTEYYEPPADEPAEKTIEGDRDRVGETGRAASSKRVAILREKNRLLPEQVGELETTVAKQQQQIADLEAERRRLQDALADCTADLDASTDPDSVSSWSSRVTQLLRGRDETEGFARDSCCANSIRSLTDREVVKHVGDVDGFGQWWESILEQLELVADDLLGFITDAQETTVDFRTVPFDLEDFYTLLEFPEYLAEHAAGDARSNASDPFEIDMWTLHSGAMYVLTHFFRGKEGDALDGYVRTANDILFNPDGTVERVECEYERQAESETDTDGQTGLESQVALAQIEQVSEDVREKAKTFGEREAALRERFAEIESN